MRRFFPLAATLWALAACEEGTPAQERALSLEATPLAVQLAPSASATSRVQVCPAIRTGTEQGQVFTACQPGRCTLSVQGLPRGVTARFPDGNTLDMPDPELAPFVGRTSQPPYPSAAATTDVRFCWQWTVKLTRDGVPGASPRADMAIALHIERPDGLPEQLDLDQRYPLLGSVTLVDADAGAPPVTGAACTAGEPLAGRWQDLATPPAAAGAASYPLGFALPQDRPLLVRSDGQACVQIDEFVNGAWTATA